MQQPTEIQRRALRQDLPPLEHDPGSTAWDFPARRRARATREGTPKRRSASKKGASRHPEGDRRGASRQAHTAFQDEARVGNKGRVCHRWWRRGERAPGTRQIGYQWAYIFSAVRPDTGDDDPGDAERQVMDRTLRRYPGPGCARRHDVRRRRLARRARPHRTSPWRCCRLTSRTQPRRAGLALPTRTLPIAPRPRRHRGHHRRLLPSRPHRRTGSYANPLRLSWIMKVIS